MQHPCDFRDFSCTSTLKSHSPGWNIGIFTFVWVIHNVPYWYLYDSITCLWPKVERKMWPSYLDCRLRLCVNINVTPRDHVSTVLSIAQTIVRQFQPRLSRHNQMFFSTRPWGVQGCGDLNPKHNLFQVIFLCCNLTGELAQSTHII